jgi:hypothetical protein
MKAFTELERGVHAALETYSNDLGVRKHHPLKWNLIF